MVIANNYNEPPRHESYGHLPKRPIQGLGQHIIAQVFLLSIIFPPVLLYAAFRTSDKRQRHWLLTLFITYFGIALPIVYDGSGDGSDGVRHLFKVYYYYGDMPFSIFIDNLISILSLKGSPGANDPFIHMISYFCGSVLGVPQLFFPIVAFIYGYFFVGTMLIVFRSFDHKKISSVVIFLALCFFLTRNFYSFQAVRNPTAIMMLLYGILQFHGTRRWRYLFVMALTPFVHFSFLLIAAPAFLYLFIGARPVLYMSIFISSFFFDAVNPNLAVDAISSYELGADKVRDRSDAGSRGADEATSTFQNQQSQNVRGWRAYMQAGFQKYALSVLVLGIMTSGVYFRMRRFTQAIFSNGLLMLSAANFFWFLEGFTGRIWSVGFFLVLGAFILWRTEEVSKLGDPIRVSIYRVSLYLSAISFVPYLLYYLSSFLDWIVLFHIVIPFLAPILPDANLTLKEILRFILPI